jgi:hypothetical protein
VGSDLSFIGTNGQVSNGVVGSLNLDFFVGGNVILESTTSGQFNTFSVLFKTMVSSL